MLDMVGYQGCSFTFKKKEIPTFFTDYFWKCVKLWKPYNEKGILPYSVGWYEHPKVVIDIIQNIEEKYNNWIADQKARQEKK